MWRRGITAAVLALCAVLPGHAAEDVFHAIPAEALAFAAVNRIAESDAKLQGLARHVQAPAASLLGLAKAASGAQKGLDVSGTAAVVVMSGKTPKADSVTILLAPVADYQEFLKNWEPKKVEAITELTVGGQQVLVAQCGRYAAIAESHCRVILERFIGAKRSIAESEPQWLAWMAENDAVVVATGAGVKRVSKSVQEEAKRMRKLFAQIGDGEAPASIGILDFYARLFQWGEKELRIAGIAAKVDAQGNVRVTKRMGFSTESPWASALAECRPLPQAWHGLPGGAFAVAGGGPWSEALTRGMAACQADFMKQTYRTTYGLDEKSAEEAAKLAAEAVRGITGISVMVGPGQPGQPLGDIVALYRLDNAERFLNAYAKCVQTIGDFSKGGDGSGRKASLLGKSAEVGGRPAFEVESTFSEATNDPLLPGAAQAVAKMFGSDGKLRVVFAAVDERTVAMSFGSSAPILRAMEATKQPKDGFAADPAVGEIKAMLAPDSQWMGCISPSGVVAFVKNMIDTVVPSEAYRPSIPDFPKCSPLGVAVKGSPGELQAEIVVTAAVLDAIGKYVLAVQSTEMPEIP